MNMKNKWLGLGLALALTAGCAVTDEQQDDAAEAQPAVESSASDDNGSYTVARGDHLWGISGQSRIYGNPYQWPLIYKANSDQIEDADLINPGQTLTINRSASAADINAAVRHAKSRGSWSLGVTEDSDKAYLAR